LGARQHRIKVAMSRHRSLLVLAPALLIAVAVMPSLDRSNWDGSPVFAKGGNGGGEGNGGGGNGGGSGNRDGKSGKGEGRGAQGKGEAQGANKGKSAKAEHRKRAKSLSVTSAKPAVAARISEGAQRTATMAAQSRRQPTFRPKRSPDQILTSGLKPPELTRLTSAGFAAVQTYRGALGAAVTQLLVPPRMSVDRALQRIAELGPDISATANDYYYPAGNIETEAPPHPDEMVGWRLSAQGGCAVSPVIGMVDTGVDAKDPALAGRDIELLSVSSAASSPEHGTLVAALLVGNRTKRAAGLLPAATLIAVDAFRGEPDGDRTDAMSLIMAIEMLAERRVDVINLSLAGPANELLRQSIDAAISRGIPVVAAVGNDGPGAEPAYPGAYPAVVAVTAVDEHMVVYRTANRGDYVDFAAPGVDVPQSRQVQSGTSFAAPFVTAALAVLTSNRPDLDPSQAEAVLQTSALDLGAPGRDGVYGWGLVQADGLCGLPTSSAAPTPAVATAH
jgi:hypothetical protein